MLSSIKTRLKNFKKIGGGQIISLMFGLNIAVWHITNSTNLYIIGSTIFLIFATIFNTYIFKAVHALSKIIISIVSAIISNLCLFIIYFLFITPVSLIRSIKKDKFKKISSTWTYPKNDYINLDKQF